MDFDLKKWAPWNWFKKEQEEQQSAASLPVQRSGLPVAGSAASPIMQLHREIDRLFDDAFRGFGFPTLAMPRWPSELPGCQRRLKTDPLLPDIADLNLTHPGTYSPIALRTVPAFRLSFSR